VVELVVSSRGGSVSSEGGSVSSRGGVSEETVVTEAGEKESRDTQLRR
jgi:hypothetical protein